MTLRHDSFADLLSLDPLQVRDGGLLVPVSQQDYDYKMEQKEPYTAGCNAAWFSWLWSGRPRTRCQLCARQLLGGHDSEQN